MKFWYIILKNIIGSGSRDGIDIFNSRARRAFLRPWTFWFLYSAHFKYISMRRPLTAIWVVFLAHKYLFYLNSDFIYCFIEHFYIRLPIFMKISSFFHILIEPNSNIAPETWLYSLTCWRVPNPKRQLATVCTDFNCKKNRLGWLYNVHITFIYPLRKWKTKRQQ